MPVDEVRTGMVIKVLIVDDSVFVCKLIKRILDEEPGFLVVGVAHNGQDAVVKAALLAPDVITMDVEMPVMDGIEAVKRIMTKTPTPILMFSSMTHIGAKATLDALSAGAIDFLPKQLGEIDGNLEKAKRCLRQRIRLVASTAPAVLRQFSSPSQASVVQQHFSSSYGSAVPATATLQHKIRPYPSAAIPRHALQPSDAITSKRYSLSRIRLLVVVASTGGPVALQKILSQLPVSCPVPVIVIQHMPSNFTHSFAERLNGLCSIQVKEAQQGDVLEAGVALLAPGGLQMEIKTIAGQYRVELRAKSAVDIYAPCADITLTSVAQHFGASSLSVILTGMGSDGKMGAVKLKQAGSMVWAQNEESCTIYGMPRAIIEAKLADKILALDDIATEFAKIG